MIHSIIHTTIQLLKPLGIWGAFLSMVVENIGIPLPTEIGYLIGRNMEINGEISYGFLLFVLTLGQVIGSLISYQIGRSGGGYVSRKMGEDSKLRSVRNRLIAWYKKYGSLTVFFTRFVGYVRPWSSFVAGFAEVSFVPFLLWTTLGTLIFNALVLYFTGILISIWHRYAKLHFYIVAVMFVLFFGFLIYALIQQLIKKKTNPED